MTQCDVGVISGGYHGSGAFTVQAEHTTADQVTNFLVAVPYTSMHGLLTNSILAGVQNILLKVFPTGSGTVLLDHCLTNTSGAGLYHAQGGGHYYLAEQSTNRNAGTTNISAELLNDLKSKTTVAPVYASNWLDSDYTFAKQAVRDTDAPDLGYHYDPVDWIVEGWAISNAVLTIDPGVVMATYHNSGIWPQSHSAIHAVGTPEEPIWFVRYNAVQEQPETWGSTSGSGVPINPYNTNAVARPDAVLKHVRLAAPAGTGYTIYHTGNWSFRSLVLEDSAVYNGGNRYLQGATNATAMIRNTLFHRGGIYALLMADGSSLSFSNCLFEAQSFLTLHDNGRGQLRVFDSVFDRSNLSLRKTCSNGFNAYLNCNTNLLPADANSYSSTNAIAWQTGPLGDYYQPTNSPLINTGSVTAAAAGLYHFTTQTNQTKEGTSQVDIGYHYVATDGSGAPVDTDGDGLADYREDTNGNGSYGSSTDLANWEDEDTDNDTLGDGLEVAVGTDPEVANPVEGTGGQAGLQVFTPLR
jgi:hypothetical protein